MPFPSMKIVVLYCLVVNCNNPFSVSHLVSKWKEVEQIAGDFWIDKMLSNGTALPTILSLVLHCTFTSAKVNIVGATYWFIGLLC